MISIEKSKEGFRILNLSIESEIIIKISQNIEIYKKWKYLILKEYINKKIYLIINQTLSESYLNEN